MRAVATNTVTLDGPVSIALGGLTAQGSARVVVNGQALTVDGDLDLLDASRITMNSAADSVTVINAHFFGGPSTGQLTAGVLRVRGELLAGLNPEAFEAGGSHSRPYRLPTDRRGVFKVGPLTVSRSDPFHLMRTGQEQKSTETLWVHPATHIVSPFPNGTTRDLEGPTSGEAPQGGIAFHTLREYVVGDDLRLIHWKSSAKVDRLMVRHNVDTYQPRTLVIFDVNAAVYEGDSFEEAVRVVASLMVANAKNNFPIRLRTTAGLVLGSETGDQIDRILDHLAAIKVNKNASLSKLAPQVATERAGFSLAVITGQAGVAELAAIGPLRARFSNVTIGRVGVRGRGGVFELPGAVLINAGTSGEFAQAWNRRIRR